MPRRSCGPGAAARSQPAPERCGCRGGLRGRRRLGACTTRAFIALLLCCAAAHGQKPGPQVLTFLSAVDDSDQPYALYLPQHFNPAVRYPLVISLHGAWSNHRLNLRRVFGKGNLPGETDAQATRYWPRFRDVEFIVASPWARGTMGYRGVAEQDVYDVLADVEKRFPIDPDRVYLTGLSMGGGGALRLGLTRPDVWAAIAAVCPYLPESDAEALAPNALNLPVQLFHGDRDQAVPVEVSRQWHKRLLNLDTNVEYIEYPGVRHNAWDLAYKDAAIFEWFAKFRRKRFPDRVRFATAAYKYNSAYWVRIDGLRPGRTASIDARFTGPNRIDVKTEGVTGFTLALEGHPRVTPRRPVEAVIDGTSLPVKAAAPVSFTRSAAGWRAGKYTPPDGAKRSGLEGPAGEAIASRHVYVYGTQAATSKEEIAARREQAERAANWSTNRVRVLMDERIVDDKSADLAELKDTNLVLFGTRRSNAVIAQLADRLPLELNPGAADYGLVFVAPVDGRYVVVNSGLPWWTGADEADRPGSRALYYGAPYTVLNTFGDYILFKGSLAQVVAEGRFDENWKLPAEARAKLEATGAVTVR